MKNQVYFLKETLFSRFCHVSAYPRDVRFLCFLAFICLSLDQSCRSYDSASWKPIDELSYWDTPVSALCNLNSSAK